MLKCKRLNLNWSIESKTDRSAFISAYLKTLPFKPTENELDMMSKYILWGKSPNGLNGRQEGLDLETSHGTWDSSPVESLDALIESPTFTETMLRSAEDPVYKVPKPQFSRAEAREYATPLELEELERLWRTIDSIELKLTLYDLHNGKRTAPIRKPLLDRFTQSEIDALTSSAHDLGPYTYLNLKHQLVELRRQQYTIRDFYKPVLPAQPTWQPQHFNPIFWGIDINVAPLGLNEPNSPLSSKLFNGLNLSPNDFTEVELTELSTLLWRPADKSLKTFDFSNPAHLAELDSLYIQGREFIDSIEFNPLNSNWDVLLDTYDAYCAMAHLDSLQTDILNMKRAHKPNDYIAREINLTYNHHYTINYISTLYHKSILTQIATTAARHRLICENLFFPENFKRCIDCGQLLLRDNINFMKKAKVKDGFDCRCKNCAKKMREKRKEVN